jgi:hypothetical protein
MSKIASMTATISVNNAVSLGKRAQILREKPQTKPGKDKK